MGLPTACGLTRLSRKYGVKVGAGSVLRVLEVALAVGPKLSEIRRVYEKSGGAVTRESGTDEHVGGQGGGAVCPGESADAAGGEDHPV